MGKSIFQFEIVEMQWERVYLSIGVRSNYNKKVQFRLETVRKPDIKREAFLIEYDKKENGIYWFRWNIPAMKGREFLGNGCWQIVAETEDGEEICSVSGEVAHRFDELSRIFRYGKEQYAYTMSFRAGLEDEERFIFYIQSYFMRRNDDWKARRYVQEASGFSDKIKKVFTCISIRGMQIVYGCLSHILPKDGRHVLFMSETKERLWGNLRAIDERLHERKLDEKFQLQYSFRKATEFHISPSSVLSWIKLIFRLARQDYIFVDDYAPIFNFIHLHKKTKLIQVWHAGVGFKSVGYSRFGKDGSPFPQESCHRKYDYVLVSSEQLIKVYAEVFGIEEEAFLPVGMPRLDGFLDENKIYEFRENFFQEYPELQHKKLILFAPTFRGTGQETAYYDESWLELERLYRFCDEDYVFLIKMHPFIKEKVSIPREFEKRVKDFSFYPNINDLYYVTDLLITDYSSNYFEYSLLKKPVLFYTPDREIYELSRGVHRSVRESAPGKVCDSFEELMSALEMEDFEVEKLYQFVEENFKNYDGHASDRVIDIILLKQ